LALALLAIFLAALSASARVLGELHRRKREIGIRTALGATRGNIIALFVYSDLARTAVAAALGALLAWWFAHSLSYLFYNVKLVDPISYFAAVAVLIGSIAIGEVLLLNRALRANPRDQLS